MGHRNVVGPPANRVVKPAKKTPDFDEHSYPGQGYQVVRKDKLRVLRCQRNVSRPFSLCTVRIAGFHSRHSLLPRQAPRDILCGPQMEAYR